MFDPYMYRTSKGLRTVVLSAETLRQIGDPHDIKEHVHRCLDLNVRVDRGTVHSWQYVNGDVRYTFQPAQ